ncbi:nephrin-like [Pecten maximus]|uniref:nephrin-like n=1 Tax=Pecten maximus TaxID=6579 RepID=UPI0014580706|nr:nephrin-like [Pecten maximus]
MMELIVLVVVFVPCLCTDPPTRSVVLSPSGTYTNLTGTTVTLDCQVEGGNPLATLSLECKGTPMTGQNGTNADIAWSRLELTIDESYHRRQCVCTAKHQASPNGVYGTESVEFNVIYSPPGSVVLSPSGTYTSITGKTVTLDCHVAGGNPLATLSWECKGTPLAGKNVTNVGLTRSRLELTIDESYHRQQCVCTAKHQASPNGVYGTESVEFNVIYPPTRSVVLSPSGTYTNITGTIVTFYCQVEGGNPLATLSWECKGTPMTWQNGTNAGIARSRLELTIDKSYHRRQCVCTATHQGRVFDERAVQFDVIYPPSGSVILSPSGTYTNHIGTTVTLDCHVAGGNPLATLSWECKGTPLAGKNVTNVGLTRSRLELKIDESYNRQQCVCTAKHQASHNGVYGTESVEFNVIYPPTKSVVLSPSGTYTNITGTTVTLNCQVEGGNPLATLSWECKGTPKTGQNGTNAGIARSRLELTIDESYHRRQCVCTATHQGRVFDERAVQFDFHHLEASSCRHLEHTPIISVQQ